MRIKINSAKVIRLAPEQYSECARGLHNKVQSTNLVIGDRIIIKEHTGKIYTGREIIGEVTAINGKVATFRKYSITHNRSNGSQNARDKHRETDKLRRFNAYI